MRNRGEVRTVGLDQNAIQRCLADRLVEDPVAKRDHAAERHIVTEPEADAQQGHSAAERMQDGDGSRMRVQCRGDVGVGVARVYDGSLADSSRKVELDIEDAPLDRPRRVIVMIVEAHLAGGDHAGIGQSGAQPVGRVLVPVGGDVRMDAGGSGEVGIVTRELERPLRGCPGFADDDDVADAGIDRACHHLGAIGIICRVGEVAVGIDEQTESGDRLSLPAGGNARLGRRRANAASVGTRPALLDGEQDRRRDENRGKGADYDAEQHDQREGTHDVSAQHRHGDETSDRGAPGQYGARERVVDGAVQDAREALVLRLVQVLAHAVEDDDGVVERISDDREKGRDDEEADLDAQDGDERDGRQDVVGGRRDRGDAEAPLEPNRQIREHGEEREEDGEKRLLAELVADLGADGFRLPYGVGIWPHHGVDGGPDGDRGGLGVVRVRAGPGDPRPDVELAIRSEGLDLCARDSLLLQRIPKRADVHRLARLDLHEGPAGELDAVIDAPDKHRDHAGRDEDGRQHVRDPPAAQEIVVGVGEESHRQMLSVDMAGRRSSQIMKKVRVTKTAVTREAAMPMISVTAKPCTGPVPNWNRKSAVSAVVTFESMIALIAWRKPSSTASRTLFPAASSSRMRSKMRTFPSTAMPMESTRPARPGSVSVAPNAARPLSVRTMYIRSATIASSPASR